MKKILILFTLTCTVVFILQKYQVLILKGKYTQVKETFF